MQELEAEEQGDASDKLRIVVTNYVLGGQRSQHQEQDRALVAQRHTYQCGSRDPENDVPQVMTRCC